VRESGLGFVREMQLAGGAVGSSTNRPDVLRLR
jgi:hypothetical protein